jgi:hypothetical protein
MVLRLKTQVRRRLDGWHPNNSLGTLYANPMHMPDLNFTGKLLRRWSQCDASPSVDCLAMDKIESGYGVDSM